MRIEKVHVDAIHRCYCVSNVTFDNENHIFLASEDPDVACNMYYGEDFKQKQNVWTAPGGCMSIIPIPGKEKEILAIQEFYLKVPHSLAKIVWGEYINNKWEFKDVISLPFVHRIGILKRNGINYIVAATIAERKKDKNDWSVPGKIYIAELLDDLSNGIHFEVLVEGLYRNHGFWKASENGIDVGYFGSDQGIVKITPPMNRNGQFQVELLMEGHIGEIATIDIDDDGEPEIITIEEFHGNTIQIYKRIDGKYKKVWKYNKEIEFAHALVGARLAGKHAFVCGVRRKECELFIVTYENGEYKVTEVDRGVGPANLCVINESNRDMIAAANHSAGEAAIYFIKGD